MTCVISPRHRGEVVAGEQLRAANDHQDQAQTEGESPQRPDRSPRCRSGARLRGGGENASEGAIPHYNVDKALLIAGQCAKGFGWGEVTRPMEFVVGDRATFEVDGHKLPVEETVRQAVSDWLAERLPRVRPGRDLVTRVALALGSTELRSIFARGFDAMVANDTSGASGYAPLSPTEAIVLGVEQFLNGPEFKTIFPDTGQDVKVFGLREHDSLHLTVAMPMLAGATASENAYFRRKEEVLAVLNRRFHEVPFAVRRLLARHLVGARAARVGPARD
jgi:S-adenosylmethionine synthetase